mgnify:CR=1 FL=1
MNPIGADDGFTITAEKYARRYSITMVRKHKFDLLKGKIEILDQEGGTFDDDIPF